MLSAARRAALDLLTADLQAIFRNRLRSICAYGHGDRDDDDTHTIVFVDQLSFDDLAACAPRTRGWLARGLAVPLILQEAEFVRTLDVFPLEYGEIIASHVVVFGEAPFQGISVSEQDRRRGCELQAKSHLIHLREGYIESGGSPKAVGQLIAASAPSLSSLLANLRRLDPAAAERAGITGELFREIATAADTTIADPSPLLARYLSAVERLWQEVDRWRA